MTLTEKVQKYIQSQIEGSPIFIDDIVRAMAGEGLEDEKKLRQNITVICSRLLHKLEGFNRFDVGIYYYTTRELAEIDHKELTQRLYVESKDGEVFGLLTGDSLAFRHGLSKHQGEVLQIMTNNRRRAQKCSKEEPVKLVVPPEDITNDNVHYFEVLELVKWDPKVVESEGFRSKLLQLVKDHDLYSIRLMAYAVAHYNQKVVLAVAKLAPTYLQQKYAETSQTALPEK